MDGRGPLVGTGFSLRRLEMPFWVRLLHTETHDLKLINAEHIGTRCTHFVNFHANGSTDAKSVYPSRHLKTERGTFDMSLHLCHHVGTLSLHLRFAAYMHRFPAYMHTFQSALLGVMGEVEGGKVLYHLRGDQSTLDKN